MPGTAARFGPWPTLAGWTRIWLLTSLRKHSFDCGNTGRPGTTKIQNPRAWLLIVARNLAEDYAKSSFRRNGTSPPQFMNGVQAREAAPLDNMEQAELFAQIRATLEELPQGDRDILTLRYALEYDAAKIAELLEINATAVHMRLSRARQKLADKLTAQGTTKIL